MSEFIKIMLDAGHGKETAGKRSPDGKLLEYKFNREMVKIVLEELNRYYNIETSYTQDPDNDYDMSLSRRVKNANMEKVNYLISFHGNAYDTYEEIENPSDEDGGISKVQTFNSAQGFEIYVISKGGKAEQLANKILYSVGNDVEGIRIRGLKVANFQILRETDMPAILIECGFMTNKEECEKMLSEEYRKLLGKAIVKGILNYLQIPIIALEDNKSSEIIYRVQVGAYKNYENAKRTQEELKLKGFTAEIVKKEV